MEAVSLISIIIPTYNSSATIKACLESLATQTFKNFDVLIIDGQSSDETIAIVEQFMPELKLTVSIQKDDGIYDAMNKGIAMAKGEYLYFLGSDDILFDTDVLKIVAAALKKSSARISYGNVKMKGDSALVKNNTIYGGEFDLKRLLNYNIPHQAIFYHKTVFEQLGRYNLNYPVFADHDFNLKAMSIFGFYYIDQIIANFAVGGSSTTLIDQNFEQDKIRNFIAYFGSKIHQSSFTSLRLYVKEAALKGKHQVAPMMRIYCLLVYTKLKLQSLLN